MDKISGRKILDQFLSLNSQNLSIVLNNDEYRILTKAIFRAEIVLNLTTVIPKARVWDVLGK